MQSRSPFFSDLADLMTDAFSAAQAAGEEARQAFRAQAERVASELDLVSREEFEAVRLKAERAETELEALKARLDAMEATPASPAAGATRKPAAKRGAANKAAD